MIQVIMLGAFLTLLAYALTYRTTMVQKQMGLLRAKDQIVTDRNLLKFDLLNRKFPPPTP